jgi:hypothetical protein
MAYESLTEQEQYEMWVHYMEMCYHEEQEKNKTAGLTSNNINPADISFDSRAETTRRSRPDRTGDLATELSQWLDS